MSFALVLHLMVRHPPPEEGAIESIGFISLPLGEYETPMIQEV